MPREAPPRWFVDETSLGLGKALALARGDVVYPGHPRLPDVPRSTIDPVWMPVVAAMGLVVISRDRRIRSKVGELEAYLEHRLRGFWIAGNQDMGTWDNLCRVTRHWDAMNRLVDERAGPWLYALNLNALSEIEVRPRTRPVRTPAPRGSAQPSGGGQMGFGL